jgi:large subunit ribosomal protein L25
MKLFKLEATPRKSIGKKASRYLRKEGLIPAVLYGRDPIELPYKEQLDKGESIVEIGRNKNKGIVVTSLTVSFDFLRKLIYTPEIFIIEIAIEGGKTVKAILKDSQYHPVTDDILHVDFLEVFDNKPVVIEVPVVLQGHAAGVRAGGKLNQIMRKIKVKGFATNIPEQLFVNIDHLQLGKVVKVGELSFDNIELVSPKNSVVCAVKMTRASQSAAASVATSDDSEDEEQESASE